MKHVLQVPGSLKIGGAEKVARDIGIHMDSAEYQTDYIVFGDNIGEYEKDVIAHGCRVFHLDEPSDNYAVFLKQLGQIMTRTRYDIVHAHTMFSIDWIMLMAKQKGIPIRVAHAHSALEDGNGLIKRCYETIMRALILHNATNLVACGESAGIRLYGEKAYCSRGQLILNGIDVRKYAFNQDSRARIRSELGLLEAFVIGHVGHLTEVKNQKYLIDLMPTIVKRVPCAKLLLLGEGEDREMLENLIVRKELESYVIMPGNVSNVHEYLSAMDVFAFPSLYEGMPLSLMEVQANGLPAVISDRVPRDVYLTNLLQPVSLDETDSWVNQLCAKNRTCIMPYTGLPADRDIDRENAISKIRAIYEM